MKTHCVVAVYERSLYGGCSYISDRCMVAVYERSLYGGCI